MATATPEVFRSEAHVYWVLQTLGEGGQGTTLIVEREDEPGSRYVLKLLRMEHVDDWKQVELFEREVSTLAALEHPGVPRLVDRIIEDDRTAGIVQTLVPGHTVAAQIAEHGPLSPTRFEQVVRQSLEILAYLHGQVPPVLHRDITPRNVMIGPERTYVIDFGAVRVGGRTDMTSVGTFGYMAPEQLIGRPQPASDVFSLGMTLVSLAERREVADLPLDERTARVDPSALLRGVEPRLRDVVLGMIEPGLGERLGDAAEALRKLDAPPPPSVALEPLPARELHPATSSPSTRTWITVLGMAVALVVASGIVWTVSSSAPPPQAQPDVRAIVATPAPAPSAPTPPKLFAPKSPSVAPPPAPAPVPAPQVVPTVLDDRNSAALKLISTPTGATATVDGRESCTTPCTMRVTFGEHELVLEHKAQRVDRSVSILQDTTLNVVLH